MRHLEFKQDSADGRATESSHLLSKHPGARLNADPIIHCLRCLHEVDNRVFGFTLNPRHVEIMAHLHCTFREVMEVFVVPSVHCLYEFPTCMYQRTSGRSGVGWVENGGNRVVHESNITKSHDL